MTYSITLGFVGLGSLAVAQLNPANIGRSNCLNLSDCTGCPTTESEWVCEHNKRRKYYHELYDTTYVPIRWNTGLASSAQGYADLQITNFLASGICIAQHYLDNFVGGENLAWNTGPTSSTIQSVMTGHTENEYARIQARADKSIDSELRFTQVVWRGTGYVGCAVATSGNCHVQVCRYRVSGNCNICSDTTCPLDADNVPIRPWKVPSAHWTSLTFADSSPCN